MNIYILRHAIAVEPGSAGFGSDAERPLTEEGEKKLAKIIQAMEAMDVSFDLIVSSPYVRARQTAEMVASAYDAHKKLQLSDTLAPDGSSKKLIDLLNRLAPPWEDVMLVGHEPYLSGLIALLVTGNEEARVQLKKGGLCKMSAESLKHGRCATLEWLLTPKQMALMS